MDAYHALLEAGVPAEDARYLLPNAAESKIVITMNVRELLHFFSLRCCNRAQWEIRDMAHRMLELARPTAPFIFADAGAPCVRGTCPEGKMPAVTRIRKSRVSNVAKPRAIFPARFRGRRAQDARGRQALLEA